MAQCVNDFDVVIAGGGPAGSSAAIHLAQRGVRVLLVEQKSFPRAKLCGEFVSPECMDHFKRLGVAERIAACKPALLTQTVFYSMEGQRIAVPSGWFGAGAALGLSRAAMDNTLLQHAKQLGVTVHENTAITDLIETGGTVRGVRMRTDKGERDEQATVTIDATGRARALVRKLKSAVAGRPRSKARLVAFKSHLKGTSIPNGTCEIYSYPGGYGGLSNIEGDVSNLCFIVAAEDVRKFGSNPETILCQTIMKNCRAQYTLKGATRCSESISVSLERFGRNQPAPAPGLLAIGDSAAFIDPFTGSGMLMALESGELVAETFVRVRDKSNDDSWLADLSLTYANEHRKKFNSRLRISALLRQVAFKPQIARTCIAVFGASEWLRSHIARATRSNSSVTFSRNQTH